jgi:hypothetical protein
MDHSKLQTHQLDGSIFVNINIFVFLIITLLLSFTDSLKHRRKLDQSNSTNAVVITNAPITHIPTKKPTTRAPTRRPTTRIPTRRPTRKPTF